MTLKTGERVLDVPHKDDLWSGYVVYRYADLISLDPPALFSERRAMERMGPIRLGLHLIARTIYHAGCRHINFRNRPSLAARLWLRLWRIERKTWPL